MKQLRKIISLAVVFTFVTSNIVPYSKAFAAPVAGLPIPGTMVNLTNSYVPLSIKGVRVHPENPLLFDFIVDTGNSPIKNDSKELRTQAEKLIKYFLATLTIPEKDLWVNLSPYEKDRIIEDQLGQTELGADMLAQDYILKQLTASLVYPEKELGKKFWDKVYAQARERFGANANIPVNMFNKVWILPDQADIIVRNNTAYVVGGHMRVMLEEDYLATSVIARNAVTKQSKIATMPSASRNDTTQQVIREIILPELEREVNQGKNFATLRQMFNSIVLASWYKKNLKQALLSQVYADKSKINGVNVNDRLTKEKIYEQYLQAYKKGVFNYIKEDVASANTKTPRKYFSGGLQIANTAMVSPRILQNVSPAMAAPAGILLDVQANMGMIAPVQQVKEIVGYTSNKGSSFPAGRIRSLLPNNGARKAMDYEGFAQFLASNVDAKIPQETREKILGQIETSIVSYATKQMNGQLNPNADVYFGVSIYPSMNWGHVLLVLMAMAHTGVTYERGIDIALQQTLDTRPGLAQTYEERKTLLEIFMNAFNFNASAPDHQYDPATDRFLHLLPADILSELGATAEDIFLNTIAGSQNGRTKYYIVGEGYEQTVERFKAWEELHRELLEQKSMHIVILTPPSVNKRNAIGPVTDRITVEEMQGFMLDRRNQDIRAELQSLSAGAAMSMRYIPSNIYRRLADYPKLLGLAMGIPDIIREINSGKATRARVLQGWYNNFYSKENPGEHLTAKEISAMFAIDEGIVQTALEAVSTVSAAMTADEKIQVGDAIARIAKGKVRDGDAELFRNWIVLNGNPNAKQIATTFNFTEALIRLVLERVDVKQTTEVVNTKDMMAVSSAAQRLAKEFSNSEATLGYQRRLLGAWLQENKKLADDDMARALNITPAQLRLAKQAASAAMTAQEWPDINQMTDNDIIRLTQERKIDALLVAKLSKRLNGQGPAVEVGEARVFLSWMKWVTSNSRSFIFETVPLQRIASFVGLSENPADIRFAYSEAQKIVDKNAAMTTAVNEADMQQVLAVLETIPGIKTENITQLSTLLGVYNLNIVAPNRARFFDRKGNEIVVIKPYGYTAQGKIQEPSIVLRKKNKSDVVTVEIRNLRKAQTALDAAKAIARQDAAMAGTNPNFFNTPELKRAAKLILEKMRKRLEAPGASTFKGMMLLRWQDKDDQDGVISAVIKKIEDNTRDPAKIRIEKTQFYNVAYLTAAVATPEMMSKANFDSDTAFSAVYNVEVLLGLIKDTRRERPLKAETEVSDGLFNPQQQQQASAFDSPNKGAAKVNRKEYLPSNLYGFTKPDDVGNSIQEISRLIEYVSLPAFQNSNALKAVRPLIIDKDGQQRGGPVRIELIGIQLSKLTKEFLMGTYQVQIQQGVKEESGKWFLTFDREGFGSRALITLELGKMGAAKAQLERVYIKLLTKNEAMTTPGGIDFNTAKMKTNVAGDKISIQFDKAMIEQFKKGDFTGVRPVILNVTPIPSILPLLGLAARRDEDLG